MVNELDSVDLNPALEYLLMVWGYEVSVKNLERYILAISEIGLNFKGLGEAWGTENDAGILQ